MITLLISLFISGFASHGSVLGEIQRFQVRDSQDAPFSSVGQINNFCTGTLVAANKVLTAGHCVFDYEQGGLTPVSHFTLARNGISQAGMGFPVVAAAVHPEYIRTGDARYDIAVLTIDNKGLLLPTLPLATDTLVIDWTFNAEKLAYESMASITGYPGDKLSGTMWYVVCMLERRISSLDRPYYVCDTYGGMSGSALLAYVNGQPRVLGVHTNGGSKNSGLFLRTEILQFVKNNL